MVRVLTWAAILVGLVLVVAGAAQAKTPSFSVHAPAVCETIEATLTVIEPPRLHPCAKHATPEGVSPTCHGERILPGAALVFSCGHDPLLAATLPLLKPNRMHEKLEPPPPR